MGAVVDLEKERAREGWEVVRPDLNIERWQLFATSQFKGNSRVLVRGDSKVIIGRVRDGSQKQGYREVGVLRIPEMKCFYALVKLWERAGRPWEESVEFSLHEIAKILRMSWGGNTFALIEEWLDRLKKIPIDWMNAYYQKDLGITESVLQSFTLLSDLVIYKRSVSGQLQQALSSFKFHERVLRNLLEHYTKPLNLSVLLSFKKEISVLLYRHLDLVMADKDRYERTTAGLLLEDLQLEGSRYRYPSRRKQVLEPALAELEGVELSTGQLIVACLERTSDGADWKAVFEKEPPVRSGGPQLSREQRAEAQGLVEEILRVTGDEHSRPFYAKLAQLAIVNPRLWDLIYRTLGEVKEEAHEGLIRTTKGAVFTDKLKRYCKERGIELGLRGS
jgi:hypothetical protein